MRSLFHFGRCPNSNLQEIANGVHRLDQLCLGGPLCPKICLRVGLWEDAGGTDEVPRGQREARISVILLSGDILTDKIRSWRDQG